MKVVVTGASGHLGVPTLQELRAAGHEVLALDCNGGAPGSGRIIDLCHAGDARDAIAGAEAVVHLANHPYFHPRQARPQFSENITMNFNVFEAARATGAKLIVFASSIQAIRSERRASDPVVRSTLPWLPLDSDLPAQPTNPYALSKHLGEEMLRYYARNTDVTAVAIRFPYLLPTPPPPEGLKDKNPWLDEAFTWLTFADAARLIAAVLAAPLRGFHTFLPAAPRPRVADTAEALRQRHFVGVPLRSPAPLASLVDCRVIERATGWTPRDL